MKVKIKRQFDRTYKGTKHTPQGESMTEPDQALTVRQLVERQKAGLSYEGAIRAGEYFEDREVPHFEDITEYKAWIEEQEALIKKEKKNYEVVKKRRKDIEDDIKNKEKTPPPKPPEKTGDQTLKDAN